jgi:hypothetical protein
MPSSIYALLFCAAGSVVLAAPPAPTPGEHTGPKLSQAALHSLFARIKGMSEELKELRGDLLASSDSLAVPNPQVINGDYNMRPQDEPSIGILKGTQGEGARWVVGANDYGIGIPIGGGLYNSEGVTYFAPFPLLAGTDGTNLILTEPPVGTGDPSIASGTTRATATIAGGRTITYAASLAFSATFCENGVQVARSFDNGRSWNRTRVPNFGVSGFVTYWDNAFDCSVFHDKEWIAVDNTGGTHDGRVYVTWSRFLSDSTGVPYLESPIMMAYSDDNATTFSTPIVISGSSPVFCTNHSSASSPATACNEDQNSTPVVLANGDVAVSFENGNGAGFSAGGRGQMLVVVFSPTTGTVRGPYQAAPLVYDGLFDFPLTNDGSRPTLCNSNFRTGVNGSLAADGSGTLYLAYWDDKKHAGEFVSGGKPIMVGDRSTGYACPAGKATDSDIYVLRSTDGGITWSDITPASGQASHDQFWPWVAANGNRVAVVFNDRSADPNNKLVDTSLALRSEGGWHTRRISTFSSNFDNAFANGAFAGDYINAAVDGAGTVHAVWTCVVPGKLDSDICMHSTD